MLPCRKSRVISRTLKTKTGGDAIDMPIPLKIFHDGHMISDNTPLPPTIPVIVDFRLDGERFSVEANFGAVLVLNHLQGVDGDKILEQLLQCAIGASHFFSAKNAYQQHDFSKEPGLYEA